MSHELPQDPDSNEKVEYEGEKIRPIYIPESPIIKEIPLSRENLVEFIRGKDPKSPGVIKQVRIWLDTERLTLVAPEGEREVILMIRQARNYENAGMWEAAEEVLKEARLAAEVDHRVDHGTKNDVREMLEKKTTFL